MTEEEIIEKIKSDFKGKSANRHGRCFYKHPEFPELKCAIGLFIPEGHKGQGLSGGVSCLLEKYPDLKKNMPYPLNLEDFQRKHDSLSFCDSVDEQKKILIKWVEDNYPRGNNNDI
jgi:hypothetical protein